jgi:glycerol-3-phosphate dehydrogenase
MGDLGTGEWAHSTEDVFWRRSKLGLRLPPEETRCLEHWFAANAGFPNAAGQGGAGAIAG